MDYGICSMLHSLCNEFAPRGQWTLTIANIEVWAKKKGHTITRTLLFNNEDLPGMDEFDWLF
ncbi:MAG: hypothetical protein EPN24_06760 [Candidatus Methanoperedens sp.]|nr:MAG: hypothetical protein EPN24_06760 [Candidatus Methanoperedens sp.]